MAKENLIGHEKFKFKLTKAGQTILKGEVEGHNFAFWKFGNWQLWQLLQLMWPRHQKARPAAITLWKRQVQGKKLRNDFFHSITGSLCIFPPSTKNVNWHETLITHDITDGDIQNKLILCLKAGEKLVLFAIYVEQNPSERPLGTFCWSKISEVPIWPSVRSHYFYGLLNLYLRNGKLHRASSVGHCRE